MEHIEQLIARQRTFFLSEATKPIDFRVQQLKKLKSVLKAYEQEMITAIDLDFKKSEFETYISELALLYTDIDEAVRKIKQWTKIKKVPTNLVNFPAKSYRIPEPLGVSLIIGAWNYPYLLTFGPLIPALAAGCTVVLKPSEVPAHTSRVIAKMISGNFDPRLISVVEGGVAETTALLQQKFDKIFFTGSGAVGKIVYQAAAQHLTPVTLELGGKSPAFFTEKINMKMAVKRLVWAKFMNAGQTCIAPDYVWVHRSVQAQFLEALVAEIKANNFSFEAGNYVQIINNKNVKRLKRLMEASKIFYGGKVDEVSRYIEPTVLTDIHFGDPVMQEEIFGPLLPVMVYDELSEAIGWVKAKPRPLSCYVFTEDKSLKNRILQEISFGGGAVNDGVMQISNPRLPFGGVGASGMGSYHGEAGFRAFTHYKSILDKPTWLELNLKYSPHTPSKLRWIKRFMK